ncbi:MAG: hypothetical protein AB4050_11555 [Synechococcus sp.]
MSDQALERIEKALQSIGADVSTLKADVSSLKDDVNTLRNDLKTVDRNVDVLEADVRRWDERFFQLTRDNAATARNIIVAAASVVIFGSALKALPDILEAIALLRSGAQ